MWHIWPLPRPDLNTCDFLLCSFLKAKMLPQKSSNEIEIKTMFVELCTRTNEDTSWCYYEPVRQLQECIQRNGSHMRIKWRRKNLHRCMSNLQEGCRGTTHSRFFIINFPVNYLPTTPYLTSKFSVVLLFVSWFTILGSIISKNMYSQIWHMAII